MLFINCMESFIPFKPLFSSRYKYGRLGQTYANPEAYADILFLNKFYYFFICSVSLSYKMNYKVWLFTYSRHWAFWSERFHLFCWMCVCVSIGLCIFHPISPSAQSYQNLISFKKHFITKTLNSISFLFLGRLLSETLYKQSMCNFQGKLCVCMCMGVCRI